LTSRGVALRDNGIDTEGPSLRTAAEERATRERRGMRSIAGGEKCLVLSWLFVLL